MGEDRRARRIPLREAADVLGISKDAVRQRIRRRTLQADKGEDGRVYVYLDASVDDVQTDEGDEGDLVDELRDRVRYLEPQDAQEPSEGTEPRSYAPGAQEGVRRPWWRRVLGGS